MTEAVYRPMERHCLAYAERARSRRRVTCPLLTAEPAVVAVAKGDAEWTVEVAIPFEAFGATPNAGEVWGFNVCRSRRAGSARPVQYTAWSPTFGGFNNPDEFGTLVMTEVAGRDDESEIVHLAFEDAPENDKTSIKTNSDISTRLQQASARLRHTGQGESWNKSVRTDGRHGFGYAFDRTAERYIELRLSDSSGLSSDDFTVMLWFKTSYPGKQVLLASTTTPPLWILVMEEIKRKRRLRFLFAIQPPTIAITADAPPADGQWHHVAVAVDRGARAVLYLDGEARGSLDIKKHKGRLKSLMTIGGPYHYFDGVLDDVCIYRGAFDKKTIKCIK